MADRTMALQILDRLEEIRQKAAEHPKDYPTDYAVRLCQAEVAVAFDIHERTKWTEELKADPDSAYHARYYGDAGQFHV